MPHRRTRNDSRQAGESSFPFEGVADSTVALSAIADVSSGIPVLGPDAHDGERRPAVRLADLAAPLGALRAASFSARRVARGEIRPGDVLVAGRGTQLHATVVPTDIGEPWPVATESVLIVRPKSGCPVLPEVIALLLGPGQVAKQLAGPARTLAHSLSTQALAEWRVPVPPMELQRHAAEVFVSTRRAIVAAARANEERESVLAAIARDLGDGQTGR